MAKIYSVNISEKKGTVKKQAGSAQLMYNYGIVDDAHSGDWHRQLSLLDYESIEEYKNKGLQNISPGAFAENVTTLGLNFDTIAVGDILKLGDALIEITQIGKECHGGCEIKKQTGDCIMPKRGLFAKVLKGGLISEGTKITHYPQLSVGILTLSDLGAKGEREDISAQTIRDTIIKINGREKVYEILPDEQGLIESKLLEWCDLGLDLILTTGGTGLSKRDVTPEATRRVIEKEVFGIAEGMRFAGYSKTVNALLSRGICGVRKGTLIVNLPGSPKAVAESLEAVMDCFSHAVSVIRGNVQNCARE